MPATDFIGDPLDSLLAELPILEAPPEPDGTEEALSFLRSTALRLPSRLTVQRTPFLSAQDLMALEHQRVRKSSASPHSASRLSEKHRRQGIEAGMRYLHKQAHERPWLPYTQGPERWNCVHEARHGHLFTNGDCSSTTTAILRFALRHSGGADKKVHRDRPNHLSYHAGYTGTLRIHGWHLAVPTRKLDQVHYGSGTGLHVALYVGGGMVLSHGSVGWHLLPYRYRGDYSHSRRTL